MGTEESKYCCPIATTFNLIGGKYKAYILWQLMDRAVRFSELGRLMPDASPKMMTQQLRELERDGLVTRTVYPEVPPKVEYSLTEKGSSLHPVLESMFFWGLNYLKKEAIEPECYGHKMEC